MQNLIQNNKCILSILNENNNNNFEPWKLIFFNTWKLYHENTQKTSFSLWKNEKNNMIIGKSMFRIFK